MCVGIFSMLEFINEHWRSAVEIILLWIGVYQVYRSFRATRGAQILVALLTLLIAITLLAYLLELKVIGFILTRSALFIAFSLIVVFQPEIRSLLAKMGSSQLFTFNRYERVEFMESFIEAVTELSNKRIGALFAMERGISLKEHRETGVELDAEFSKELAMTIFFPKTALHDGGMVIAERRVAAAGCVFPVSAKELKDRTLGLRHRAAIGLTEVTDALAVVVSEETGSISVCVDGRIFKDLKTSALREKLEMIFVPEEQNNEEDIQEQSDSQDGVAADSDSDMVRD